MQVTLKHTDSNMPVPSPAGKSLKAKRTAKKSYNSSSSFIVSINVVILKLFLYLVEEICNILIFLGIKILLKEKRDPRIK